MDILVNICEHISLAWQNAVTCRSLHATHTEAQGIIRFLNKIDIEMYNIIGELRLFLVCFVGCVTLFLLIMLMAPFKENSSSFKARQHIFSKYVRFNFFITICTSLLLLQTLRRDTSEIGQV